MNIGIKILSLFFVSIGISAVIGGYKLLVTNGLGMSVALLKDSPFTSYFYPALILIFVIGGTYLVAGVFVWTKNRYVCEVVAIAGFALLIWLFTEMYIMHISHWLHVIYFAFGIFTIIICMVMLRFTIKNKNT
jgi:hypothetical protein